MNARLALTLLSAVAVSAAELSAPATPRRAPASLELRDQYDTPRKLTFPAAQVTLLAIADKQGAIQVDGWIAALAPGYRERIDIRGLASCAGAPRFLQGRIRKRFQETRTYPVLMDWSGAVCRELGYRTNAANILVLGRDGTVLARFLGAATPSAIRDASAVLDAALAPPTDVAAAPPPIPTPPRLDPRAGEPAP